MLNFITRSVIRVFCCFLLVCYFSQSILIFATTLENDISSVNQELIFLKEQESQNKEIEQNLGLLITKSKLELEKLDQIITKSKLEMLQQELKIADSSQNIENLKVKIRAIILKILEIQDKNWLDLLSGNYTLVEILNQQNLLESLQKSIDKYLGETTLEKIKLEKEQKEQVKMQSVAKELETLENIKLEENKELLIVTKNKQENYNILLQKLEKDKQEIQIALENYVKQEEENKKQNLTKKIKSNLLSHLAEDSKYQTTGDCSFESQQTISLNAKDFVNPTNGVITSTFGCQHDGLDIAAKSGTSVVSIGDGIVYRYGSVAPDCKGFGCNGGFGNYVQIQHTLADGTKIYSLYGHMKNNPLVGLGSGVKKGQQIGEIGCTGYTLPYPCGVHLHFMIFDDTTEESGFGCRLGSSKCFDPQKFGFFQK